MRILVAAPPKTGNMWLKCLLGTIYDLRWLSPSEFPKRPNPEAFCQWVDAGHFPDGTIFHQHYPFDAALCDAADRAGVQLVTLVRNPYDAFVSTFFTLKQHRDEETGRRNIRTPIAAGTLDAPEVIEHIRNGGYRGNLTRARDWMQSGRATVVRYEDLHDDARAALAVATGVIAPASAETIDRAVRACSAENMRRRSQSMAKHVRAAKPDDSLRRLNEEHYAAFRDTHAEIIAELGYEVR